MEQTISERKGFLHSFDKYTSKNGTDWYLALTWIFILELISSIIEFYYLDVARDYVIHIEKGMFRELLIAGFISFFVWHFVYSVVQMRRQQFLFLLMYLLLGLYFYITDDVTFNLLFHNIINPFEFEFNGFNLYTIVQVFIKLVMLYLIIKFFQSLKNRDKLKQ
ncbi:hypothetical protein CP960_01095 [Malaciobacter halophilus]|uniref:Uncharacterized protein n=1 Tax=Malaciobacter halophilus TaxID=197482 RepID=A0A2N1J689_9BACT|nr:hypothetical protein [Malaciobacter halophilus]AXH08858.1 putative membrane protein [Malaciobacter halophilus]PKI82087.1 hypothetical protein CP960_01095 [Malaciobacter halophilus]